MFRQAVPPRKRNRFANAVEELGGRILRGDLKPGEILPNEAELGRELGASRTVVREAVKSLAAKGLLQPRTRTGTRVLESIHWNLLDLDVLGWRYAAMPRSQFFRELFEIRRMIEPAAAALAAERATGAHLEALEQAYLAMEAVDHGSDAAIDADLRFHRAILAGSRNDLLLQMGGLISVGLLASFRISRRSYDAGLPLHKRVFEAIRNRHPEPARENMAVLLSSTREFLERELAGLGHDSADEVPAAAR